MASIDSPKCIRSDNLEYSELIFESYFKDKLMRNLLRS